MDKPPKTASFEDTLNRVEAFLKPQELTSDLKKSLQQLNITRNNLEHYAIEIDEMHLLGFLTNLKGPLVAMFERTLGDIRPRGERPAETVLWSDTDRFKEYVRLETEVISVMKKFGGQTVSLQPFGSSGQITLPKFDVITREASRISGAGSQFDYGIVGYIGDTKWIVEIRKDPSAFPSKVVRNLAWILNDLTVQFVWFIQFDPSSTTDISHLDHPQNVFVTSGKDWGIIKEEVQR